MPTKEISIAIDCANADIVDVVAACTWRVDPVRAKILKIDEAIKRVRLTNLDQIRLPPDMNSRISALRISDVEEANIAIQELLLGWLLLWIPAEVHRHVRSVLELSVHQEQQEGFTWQNISDLLEEMKMHEEKIVTETAGRIIEKAVKPVFEQSVLPRLDSLTVGQREILKDLKKLDGLSAGQHGILEDLKKLESMQLSLSRIEALLNKR